MLYRITFDDSDETAKLWFKMGKSMGVLEAVEGEVPLGLPAVDECMRKALLQLEANMNYAKKKLHGYDYAWILQLTNDVKGDNMPTFNGVTSFRNYLLQLGIKRVCGISTLNEYYNKVSGKFPEWTFTDEPNPCDGNERLRRVNIARMFLTIYRQLYRQYLAMVA